jgi:predicted RNase H-like HicB family nuclease
MIPDDEEALKMDRKKYVYWQEEDMWLGYLEEYPDYKTQGESLEELKKNLKDICQELTNGNIPCVRKVAELDVA